MAKKKYIREVEPPDDSFVEFVPGGTKELGSILAEKMGLDDPERWEFAADGLEGPDGEPLIALRDGQTDEDIVIMVDLTSCEPVCVAGQPNAAARRRGESVAHALHVPYVEGD